MDLHVNNMKVLHKKSGAELDHLPTLISQQLWAAFSNECSQANSMLETKVVFTELLGGRYNYLQFKHLIYGYFYCFLVAIPVNI